MSHDQAGLRPGQAACRARPAGGRVVYVRTTDVSGVLDLGVVAQAKPGETAQVTVELGKPVALDVGQSFAVREGGRTVGAGTVIAVLDLSRRAWM
jgi:translation elongation factor EF-Tu-like GTPase